MSAIDNVANGLLYRGMSTADRRDAAAEALRRVGLGPTADAHAEPDVGWGTPTCGHRPRDRQPPLDRARRRADRQPRLQVGRRGDGAAARAARRRAHDPDHHPRPRAGGIATPPDLDARRGDRADRGDRAAPIATAAFAEWPDEHGDVSMRRAATRPPPTYRSRLRTDRRLAGRLARPAHSPAAHRAVDARRRHRHRRHGRPCSGCRRRRARSCRPGSVPSAPTSWRSQAGQGFGRGTQTLAGRRRQDGQPHRAGHCGQLDRHRRRDRAAHRRHLRPGSTAASPCLPPTRVC